MVPQASRSRAVVTGATAGIGRAFATALAARGDEVILVARDQRRLGELADELRSRHGVGADVVTADLATDAGTDAVCALLSEPSHPVDLLVNNAGFGQRLGFGDNDLAEEERALDVLVRAPLRLCHAALPGMRDRQRGSIINVSSVAGWIPRGTYGAHKAWLTSFTRWLDLAYRRDGVQAMALCPGFVRTEFHQRMDADMDGIPAWMWLDPDAVVAAALRDLARGVRVSVPSRRYRLLSRLARVAPATLVGRAAPSDR
ncbi:MAG: SDR family NAD(P)-dependent oxidoreductase [Actinomycetota bacterium]|nr:SDR family NAD(P)-dependent oxidoreductase [Actinomycetota bacterium]